MKSDKTYLQHILAMVERIESATVEGKVSFISSTLHQDAALRNLHTMTETTQRLSSELKVPILKSTSHAACIRNLRALPASPAGSAGEIIVCLLRAA